MKVCVCVNLAHVGLCINNMLEIFDVWVSYVFIIIESPDDKDEEDNDTTNIHTKPMYLKDYERNRLLEKGVEAGLTDSEDEEEKDESTTYVQEQLKLKERYIQM